MFGFNQELKEYDLSSEELSKLQYAKIDTNKGTIYIKLYSEETPIAVANFAHLANSGFYNDLGFHRVIEGFMAQGGCPDGTGAGGPGWQIACETEKNTHRHQIGTLSMAHAGKDTGGSQFFICFVPCPHLDGVHTVFGGIEDGDSDSFNILSSLTQGDLMQSVTILDSKK